MTRIKENHSTYDVMFEMSEGDPGAMSVLCELTKKDVTKIHAEYGLEAILILDGLEIYASNIWLLYKDVCNENILFMTSLLFAYKRGLISVAEIHHAIKNNGEGIRSKDDERLKAFQMLFEKAIKFFEIFNSSKME